MSKQASKVPTVDYSKVVAEVSGIDSPKDARAYALRVGKAYRKSDDLQTVRATLATREALRTGWLSDGRSTPIEGGLSTVNGAAFGKSFGVTGGLVSRWRALAAAMDAGVIPGTILWTALTSRLCRTSEGRKAMHSGNLAAIQATAEADGYNLETGVRTAPPASKPRSKATDKGDKVKPGDVVQTKVSPKDAKDVADEAVTVLGMALSALPVTSGNAEVYASLRGRVLAILREEDKRRNVATISKPRGTRTQQNRGKVAPPAAKAG